jgi:hypothetical protein
MIDGVEKKEKKKIMVHNNILQIEKHVTVLERTGKSLPLLHFSVCLFSTPVQSSPQPVEDVSSI